MGGLYYKSNNARENAYTQMRKEEEKLANEQQDKLDLKRIENLEEMAQAKKYSKLFKNTMGEIVNSTLGDTASKNISKLASKVISTANASLADIIKNGKLDEFVKKITSFSKSDLEKLSKRARLVIKDLNDPSVKSIINEELLKAVSEGKSAEEIATLATELMAGEGNEGKKTVEELVKLSTSGLEEEEKKRKKREINKQYYEKRKKAEAIGKEVLASTESGL